MNALLKARLQFTLQKLKTLGASVGAAAAARPDPAARAEIKRLVAEGAALDEQSRPAEALEAYRRAAALDPACLPALRGVVKCAALTGRSREVIDAGRKALELFPRGGRFYIWIADAMVAERASPEEVAWLDGLAEAHAPAVAARNLAILLLTRGDRERAKVWLRRALPDPDRPIADGYFDFIDPYIDALAEQPEGAEEQLFRLLMHAGRLPQAKALADAIKSPGPQTAFVQASLLNEAGDPAAAEAAFARLAKAAPSPAVDEALALTRAAQALQIPHRAFPPPRAAPPLKAVVSPVRRDKLASWIFVRRFGGADRGDLVRAEIFRPGSSDGRWLHPAYAGSPNRLTPNARQDPNGYFMFDFLAEEILDELRAGRGFLGIECGQEGMFSAGGKADVQKIADMMDYARSIGLPLERLILIDNNTKSPDVLRRHGLDALKVVEDRYLWLELAGIFRELRRQAGGADERLITTAQALERGERRDKAFLSYNHAPRAHRSVLVAWMLEQGLAERGLISFQGAGYLRDRKGEYADEQWIERTLGQIAGFAPLIERPEAAVRRLLELSPMKVDVDLAGTGRTAKALAFGANEAWPYLSSYFSVVTDTVFSDGRSSHVTEKIIKPIANLHPFIYVGEPFALADLRARGYRTFAPLIDESYDEITDPVQRMTAALAEVDRLARLPAEQLHELFLQLWPRLQHNYLHLVDGGPYEAQRILERVEAAMVA